MMLRRVAVVPPVLAIVFLAGCCVTVPTSGSLIGGPLATGLVIVVAVFVSARRLWQWLWDQRPIRKGMVMRCEVVEGRTIPGHFVRQIGGIGGVGGVVNLEALPLWVPTYRTPDQHRILIAASDGRRTRWRAVYGRDVQKYQLDSPYP